MNVPWQGICSKGETSQSLNFGPRIKSLEDIAINSTIKRTFKKFLLIPYLEDVESRYVVVMVLSSKAVQAPTPPLVTEVVCNKYRFVRIAFGALMSLVDLKSIVV